MMNEQETAVWTAALAAAITAIVSDKTRDSTWSDDVYDATQVADYALAQYRKRCVPRRFP